MNEHGVRFLSNTLFSIAHQSVVLILGLVLVPAMLLHMGQEKYGVWLVLQIFCMGGLVPIGELGFQSAIIRDLARRRALGDEEGFQRTLVTGWILLLVLGIAVGGLVLLFGRLFFEQAFKIPAALLPEAKASLVVCGCSVVVGYAALGLKAYYAGTQDYRRLKLWESGSRLLLVGSLILLLRFSTSVLHAVILEQVLMTLFFVAFIPGLRSGNRTGFPIGLRYFSWEEIKNLRRLAFQLFLNRLSWFVYQNGPEVLVASLLGSAPLTSFSIVAKIPRALKVLQSALNSAILPMAVTLESTGFVGNSHKALVLQGGRYTFLLFTPVVAVCAVFAPDILALWLAPEYECLGNLLRAFLAWQFMALLTAFVVATLTKPEHYARLLPVNFLGNLVFLVMLFVGIHQHGLWSVLAGLLVSGTLTVVATLILSMRVGSFTFVEFFQEVLRGPILGVGLVIGLAAALSRWLLHSGHAAFAMALLLGSFLAYFFFFAFWGLRQAERELIGTLIRRAFGLGKPQ